MTSAERVQLELAKVGRGRDRAAIIRLNRPDQLNPIDWATVHELDARIDEIESDSSVRCVLVT
ncbi:MAG: 2-(1,2-epoxy-1,2-dihydrophenyl)acetyl-CoA isomerase, partial [Acidimicrobiales bacterium]